jgi:uncharacterized hydrophobic protein (TIGR00271 family)
MPQSNAQEQTSPKAIPDYARTALVPVANPNTAADLLRLAASLAHPDNGKVIALKVSLAGAEKDARAIEEIEAIVQSLHDEGLPIEVETISTTSVARGILDAAREHAIDLIIMGVYKNHEGLVQLGTIVESVIDTAPCDVLIYRASRTTPVIKRVIAPIDNVCEIVVSARMGIRLARHNHIPIEAVQVDPHRKAKQIKLRINRALKGIPLRQEITPVALMGENTAEEMLGYIKENDLVIVGFTRHDELEGWMSGELADAVLNQTDGPVVLVARAIGGDDPSARFRRRVISWVRPVLTRFEQDEIVRQSHDLATINIDYAVLILVSATLATLGLLLNSAAVIIGAMLVAPLMSPLIALSTGLTVGQVTIARQSFSTLVIGMLTAVLVAAFLGVILPIGTPTFEMTARGNPSLIDAGVALASGVIGAYATARKDIPSALAGVAIAAALMPPVCTIGLGMAFRDANLAYGATVLFLTNIISIILAGSLVFVWLGMGPRRYENIPRTRQVLAILIFALSAVLVIIGLLNLTHQANIQSTIEQELSAVLYPDELVETELIPGDPLRVVATIRTTHEITDEDVATIQRDLTGVLGEPVQVELVVQQVIRFSVEEEAEPIAAPEG